ncbi:MAG: DNA primase [Pseudomonadota bacterium]
MAGRIPQSFLDELLNRVDIVDVIDRRVKLKKTGKNYSACCPFHEEKTPSFSVNPDKQFYYCFGCGATGNAITFVMEYDNTEFPQAVESLAASCGLEVPRESASGRDGTSRSDTSRPLYDLMAKVAQVFQEALREHPEAKHAVDYLKGRGLTGHVARDFGLGFAPPGWDYLLKIIGDNDQRRQQLIDIGMLVESENGKIYDRFRNRVMFPIRDRRGRVIAFGGRVLGDDKPKYLNSPETAIFRKAQELYGLYEARQKHRQLPRVLVVEGYMDVIALAQYGITYATATLGTATSKTHVERIFKVCPEVVFCFDGDSAGRKAALRALEAALPSLEDGRQARFLFLPEGEDPDDAVRAGGAERFEQLLDSAVPLETFLFQFSAQGLNMDSLDGRARMSKIALPFLRQLPEGVYRQLMFQSLAERTGLELASLLHLESAPEDSVPPPAYPEAELQSESLDAPLPELSARAGSPFGERSTRDYSNMAQAAIALLLHRPDMAKMVEPHTLGELEGQDVTLLIELIQLLHRRPDSSTAMLLGHWYGTPQGDLLNRLAGQERLIPAAGIEHEFSDTLRALIQLPADSKLSDKVDKLKLTNYSEISDREKQELKQLLAVKAQRDAQRSKPE